MKTPKRKAPGAWSAAGVSFDEDAAGNLKLLSHFYSGIRTPLTTSAIVRRALSHLAHHARQLHTENRAEALLVEKAVAGGFLRAREVA